MLLLLDTCIYTYAIHFNQSNPVKSQKCLIFNVYVFFFFVMCVARRFDCFWINGVLIMLIILSSMNRLTILKQHIRPDLMIYRRLIKSRPNQIKRRHTPNYQMRCQPMVFIKLTEAMIIRIQIKCTRLHRLLLQQPVIYQQTATPSITIQAPIDTGQDFRTQLTKGEKYYYFFFHYILNFAHPNFIVCLYFFCLFLVVFTFCSLFSFGSWGFCSILQTNLCTMR